MDDSVPPILSENQGKLLGDLGLPELLPSSVGNDDTVRALAAAMQSEIELLAARMPTVLLWPAISRLDEPRLTHLAAMVHADWWDESWSVEAKRAFLFRQIPLHRKKGTPWAVEEAVSIVYGPARVREWFEYGGRRGCFRLDVEVQGAGLSQEEIGKIELMVERYKRKSQHFCGEDPFGGIAFSLSTRCTARVGAAATMDEVITVKPYIPAVELPEATGWPVAVADVLEVIVLRTEDQ